MLIKIVFVVLVLSLNLCIASVFACSAVFLSKGDYKIVGRTHDWMKNRGLIKFHKKAIRKTALLWGDFVPENAVPIKWTSQNDSIIFTAEEHNNYYMSIGGINDKGLSICELYVDHYKTMDLAFNEEKHVLMGADWVEYVLDNYSSVDEVMRNLFDLRLINTFKCHWFICDASGANAVVEYVNGNLRVYYGQPLTIPVLTNTIYSISCNDLVNYRVFGGNKRVIKKSSSIARFVNAYEFLQKYKPGRNPTLFVGKEVMRKIVQPSDKASATQWISVYDLNFGIVYYRKAFDPVVYSISLKDLEDKPNGYVIDRLDVKVDKNIDAVNKAFKMSKDAENMHIEKKD